MTIPQERREELRDAAEGHLRFGGGGDDLANGVLALLDALDQAEDWADENAHPLIMRQGEILTGVALALNGPTPPLTSWSHHDLAEKATAMTAALATAEARLKAVQALVDHADRDGDAHITASRVQWAIDGDTRGGGS